MIPNIGNPMTALWRLTLYGAFTVPCMLVQAIALVTKAKLRDNLPIWYHRRCCKILGFRVERRGRQSREHPTLYVANHVSYWDIMVLGSLIRGSFIAKAEVATWPFFGWLAKLQRTVFVERRVKRTAEQRDEIQRRLVHGDDLILFPEGTSGDGNWVLPFKSALFSVAQSRVEERAITVQPVSIAYTRLDGVPMGRYLRPLFAWYGDMELAGHLWRSVGMGFVTVVVEFHQPVTIEAFSSRKELSEHCHRCVVRGLAAALSGRPQRKKLQAMAAQPLPEAEAGQ